MSPRTEVATPTEPGTWQEQYERVWRWLSTLGDTDVGRVHDRISDSYQDEVYAFFQNCYHLKDWLKNDPASAGAVSDVEAFISSSPSLSVCADLANGSKHLTLTSHRVDPDAAIGARHYEIGPGSGGIMISVKYEVRAGGTTHDAYTLSQQCWDQWQTYLFERGLISGRRTMLPRQPIRSD
jgi:hypothetical protein